jgi:hypothetical protein
LYWTNNHHDNATIERSFLNGTGREVLLRGKELHQPLAVAIDVENNRLYWSNEEEGIYYSIKSMDLNVKNGTKQKLISGTRHRPFAMAVDEQNVYWSDWINRAVWSLPKNSLKDGVVNTRLAEYDMDHTPMALMTPSGNTTKVNNTYCALHREKVRSNSSALPLQLTACRDPPAGFLEMGYVNRATLQLLALSSTITFFYVTVGVNAV